MHQEDFEFALLVQAQAMAECDQASASERAKAADEARGHRDNLLSLCERLESGYPIADVPALTEALTEAALEQISARFDSLAQSAETMQLAFGHDPDRMEDALHGHFGDLSGDVERAMLAALANHPFQRRARRIRAMLEEIPE